MVSTVTWDTTNSEGNITFSNGNHVATPDNGLARNVLSERACFQDVYYWETKFLSFTFHSESGLGLVTNTSNTGVLGTSLSSLKITADGNFNSILNNLTLHDNTGKAPTGAINKVIRHWLDVKSKIYRIAFEDSPSVWIDIVDGENTFSSDLVWIPCVRAYGPSSVAIYGTASECMFSAPAGTKYLSESPTDFNSYGLNVTDSEYQSFLLSTGQEKVILLEADYVSGLPTGNTIQTDDTGITISSDGFSVSCGTNNPAKAYSQTRITQGDKKYFEVRIDSISDSENLDLSIGVISANNIAGQSRVGDSTNGSAGFNQSGTSRINNVEAFCIIQNGISVNLDGITIESFNNFMGSSEGSFYIDGITISEEQLSGETGTGACQPSFFAPTGILLQSEVSDTNSDVGISTATNISGNVVVVANPSATVNETVVWRKQQVTGDWMIDSKIQRPSSIVAMSPDGNCIAYTDGTLVGVAVAGGSTTNYSEVGTFTTSGGVKDISIEDDKTVNVVYGTGTISVLTGW